MPISQRMYGVQQRLMEIAVFGGAVFIFRCRALQRFSCATEIMRGQKIQAIRDPSSAEENVMKMAFNAALF